MEPSVVISDSGPVSQVLGTCELVYMIGNALSTADLVRLARTCKRLFEIIRGDALLAHTFNPRRYEARLLGCAQELEKFGYVYYRREPVVHAAAGCSQLVARGPDWLLIDLTTLAVPAEDARTTVDQRRLLRLVDLRSRVVHVARDLVGPNGLETTRLANAFAITVNPTNGRLERVYGLSDRYGEVFCWRCDWDKETVGMTEVVLPDMAALDVLERPTWQRRELGMAWACPDGTVIRGFFPDKGDSRTYLEVRDPE